MPQERKSAHYVLMMLATGGCTLHSHPPYYLHAYFCIDLVGSAKSIDGTPPLPPIYHFYLAFSGPRCRSRGGDTGTEQAVKYFPPHPTDVLQAVPAALFGHQTANSLLCGYIHM